MRYMRTNKNHYVQAYLALIQSYQKINQVCLNSDLMHLYRKANCCVCYLLLFQNLNIPAKRQMSITIRGNKCNNMYKNIFVYCLISAHSKLEYILVYLKYHIIVY